MAMYPDGKRLLVACGGTNAVAVVDTETMKVSKMVTERMGRRPWGVAITPDGKKIYTANGLSDSVSVIDATTFSVTKNIKAGRGAHSVVIGVVK
jgi:YVTN family beta-propeller protein